jgi:hypothetical protein
VVFDSVSNLVCPTFSGLAFEKVGLPLRYRLLAIS